MNDHRDAPCSTNTVSEPRYQRFVRALALGALAVGATTGCGGSTTTDTGPVLRIDAFAMDAGTDASSSDAGMDVRRVVDGPLPPPDLPRRV